MIITKQASELKKGMVVVIGEGIAYEIESVIKRSDGYLLWLKHLQYPMYLTENVCMEIVQSDFVSVV